MKVPVRSRRESRDDVFRRPKLVNLGKEAPLEHGILVHRLLVRGRLASQRLDRLLISKSLFRWRFLVDVTRRGGSLLGPFLHAFLELILRDHLSRLFVKLQLGSLFADGVCHGRTRAELLLDLTGRWCSEMELVTSAMGRESGH